MMTDHECAACGQMLCPGCSAACPDCDTCAVCGFERGATAHLEYAPAHPADAVCACGLTADQHHAFDKPIKALPDLLTEAIHALTWAEGLLYRLPVKADPVDRQSLETWAGRLRAAIAADEVPIEVHVRGGAVEKIVRPGLPLPPYKIVDHDEHEVGEGDEACAECDYTPGA